MKILNFKLKIVLLLILFFAVAPKFAHAGLILKFPSTLGLSTSLVGYWSFDANTFGTSTLFAVNSAGLQYVATDGTYSADYGSDGGGTASVEDPIANTTDDTLYQSERYGNFSYEIPVGSGTYSVTLKFAETYFEAEDSRVFDVDIEGVKVIDDLDIYAVAGHDTAYDLNFITTVSDGALNIVFTNEVDNAKICAIKVTGLGLLDLSPSGLNGTIIGGVRSPGKIGQGFKFNGTSDSITLNNTTFASDFTISAWVKSDDLSSYNAIVGKEGAQNYIAISSTGAHWLVGNSYSNVLNSAFNTKNWQHVVFVRSGNNILVYRNGAYVGQNEGYGASTLALTAIGAGDDDLSPPFAYFMNGSLDDVRIYDRAISQSEITRLYNIGAGTKVNKSYSVGSAGSLQTGLIGHWTFDGDKIAGVSAYDSSGNSNTATLTSGPTLFAGKIGQGIKLDGSDDYVVVDNESNFDFERTSPFSMAVWLKSTPGDTSIQQIIGKASDYTPYKGIHFFKNYDDVNGVRAGSLSFVINSTWGDDNRLWVYATNVTPINDGNWHHYTITYDGSSTTGGMKIYQDGSLLTTSAKGSLSNSILNDIALGIGARGDGSPQYHENFNGLMDDARVYNRELSASEVKQIYNLGAATKTSKTDTNTLNTGLVGHWTFDGNKIAGTQAYDSSSTYATGTISGATKIIGKIGQALDFDGSDDYIDSTNPAELQINSGTISAWIKTSNAGSSFRGIVVKQYSYSMFLGGNVCADNVLGLYDWSASLNRCSTSGSLADDKWHFVVATFQSGVENGTTFYVDGVNKGSVQMTVSSQTNNNACGSSSAGNRLTIGTNCGSTAGQAFNGSIDDARIYNRVLSAEEVKRLYQMGI